MIPPGRRCSTTQQNNDRGGVCRGDLGDRLREDARVAAQWDVRIDNTMGLGGFAAENLDWATANSWLHSLTGGRRQGGPAGLRQRRPSGVSRHGARARHDHPARTWWSRRRSQSKTQAGREHTGITGKLDTSFLRGSLPVAARTSAKRENRGGRTMRISMTSDRRTGSRTDKPDARGHRNAAADPGHSAPPRTPPASGTTTAPAC